MKISVAICTYNGELYVEEQLMSICNQSRRPDEIIIFDDASTDNTVKIIKRILSSKNIEYTIVENEKNMGVTKNFENAIKKCTGDIIFTSDQDDVWYIDKVKIIERIFKENKKCNLVFTNASLVDSELKEFKIDLWKSVGFKPSIENKYIIDILLNRCVVTGATMAIRNCKLEKLFPIPNGWLHDGWLAIIYAMNNRVLYLDKKLILYRQHSNNVVGAKNINLIGKIKSYFNNIKKIKKVRSDRLKRYKSVYNYSQFYRNESTDINNKLNRCIYFWEDMNKLNSKNRLKSIHLIIKNIINKNYNIFYTGVKGAIRDVISLYVS